MTVPPPCPQCRGSGYLFYWHTFSEGLKPRVQHWWLWNGLGYRRVGCPLCHKYGSLFVELSPDGDSRKWLHRVPPEVAQEQLGTDSIEGQVLEGSTLGRFLVLKKSSRRVSPNTRTAEYPAQELDASQEQLQEQAI